MKILKLKEKKKGDIEYFKKRITELQELNVHYMQMISINSAAADEYKELVKDLEEKKKLEEMKVRTK